MRAILKSKLILLVIPFMLLSACGASLFAASPAAGTPTSLQVRRVNLLPGNHYSPLSPLSLTDQQKVQSFYQRIQALPHMDMNAGPRFCPVDLGLEYQLDFFQGSTLLQEATYRPGGCSAVILGKNDVRVPDPSFSQAFAQTLGLSEKELFPEPLYSCNVHSPCPSPTP